MKKPRAPKQSKPKVGTLVKINAPDDYRVATSAPVKSEPEERCGTCHYWRDGRCKRYPPVTGAPNATHTTITAETDWCGDWRQVA